MTCVAEVVDIFSTGKGRTACRLYCDKVIVSLATELSAHKWRNEAAKV